MIDDEFTGDLRQDWNRLMAQDEIWIDKAGNKLFLNEMEPRYCGNVYSLMLRSLPGLARADSWSMMASPGPSGDMACDAFQSEIDRLEHIAANPNEYAAESPLMKALLRRIEGLPAREEERQEDTDMDHDVSGTFDHRPQTVIALNFEFADSSTLARFQKSLGPFVEVTMNRVPGPGRGIQTVLQVRSINLTVEVPVGDWLLVEGDRFWRLGDEEFRRDYQSARVEAEILCYCGDPRRSDNDPQHALCFPGMD